MLNSLYDIALDVFGSVLMMVTLAFGAVTFLAIATTWSMLKNKELTFKERLLTLIAMSVVILWGAWLTQFVYHLGVSCLTN